MPPSEISIGGRRIGGRILFLTLLATAKVPAQGMTELASNDPKVKVANSVYSRIQQAWGMHEKPPALRVLRIDSPQHHIIARFDPDQQTISLEEETYDLCERLDKGTGHNALAVVLGHELAHFYRKHLWGRDFSDTPLDLPLTTVQEMEGSADYFGMFYAFVAGYDVLDVAPKVYTSIYEHFLLTDASQTSVGYPPLILRQGLVKEAVQKVAYNAPIFEAGNRMLLIQEWTEAALCFDELSRQFPSPEVYNNAGVAKAMDAASRFTEADVSGDTPWARFRYPFVPDSRNQLSKTVLTTPQVSPALIRQHLLTQARVDFENARRINPSYVPASINLTLGHRLLGETAWAKAYGDEAVKLAEAQPEATVRTLAYVAKALANSDNLSVARTLLLSAKKVDPDPDDPMITWNIAALIADPKDFHMLPQPDGEKNLAIVERIDSLFPDRSTFDAKPPDRTNVVGDASNLLPIMSRETSTAILMAVGRLGKRRFFISCKSSYTGGTQASKDIRIGAPKQMMLDVYGKPSTNWAWRGEIHYRYDHLRIIFSTKLVAGKEVISGWTLYGKE